MKIIPEPVAFEWDEGNKIKNEKKHGVFFKEAEEVCGNEPKFLFSDEKHSKDEKRYGLFGITNTGRHLSLVFTVRKSVVRIITARPMSRRERRAYETIKENSSL